MAQVSTGSFNTTSAEGRYLTFKWSVDNTNIASNYKEIYWSLVGAGASGYVTCGNFKVVIDGETVFSSATRVDVWVGTVIASGYKKIYHSTNGTRSFSASAEAGIYEFAVNCSGSGSWELPTIPRYATITSFYVSKRDETSVLFNATADSTCDYAWYSTDDGANWYPLPSTNIVGGLSANTTYKFKIRLRRSDSQLTTDSQTYQQTTYNYPHCTGSPDFTIGDNMTLSLYNPLSRSVSIYLELANGSVVGGDTVTGTSISGYSNEYWQNAFYTSIPVATFGRYKVRVIYGSVTMTSNSGSTYSIRGNEVPTINAFDYIDNNSDVVKITGVDYHIVQNKSILRVRLHSATANYGASGISRYVIECNGVTKTVYNEGSFDMGTIDSARNVDLKLTAYDSRGLYASKSIPVNIIPYEPPKANVELRRLNNYEDETYLTVDSSKSSINGKNTTTIKYRYKVSGGNYGSYESIPDGEEYVFSLDKNNAYIFEIVVTDALGSTFTKEYVLNKGVFPLFIDTVKNSVGINCFPSGSKSLEVNGVDVLSGLVAWKGYADTNANNIKAQGVWIVPQGTSTNYPNGDGNGLLIVFATPYNIYYQIFTRYDGTSWGRMCWYDNWQGWKLISS